MHRSGFSILEILIVVFIIGLGASLVMPRLLRRAPDIEWSGVRDELNNMLYYARQEAITSQKVHRLVFNQKKRIFTVEIDDGFDAKGRPKFEQAHSYYFTSTYEIPEPISLISVCLGKKDLLEETKHRTAHCYVMPHGLVQDVEIVLERNSLQDEEETGRLKIKVAPFLGVFDEVERVG